MDPRDLFQVLLGVGGLLLASYGVRLLMTRRMSPLVLRTWRRPIDAGMFFLCGGLSFLLLAAGYLGRLSGVFGPATGWTLAALAIAFLALSVVRYRPRGSRHGAPDVT
ncbi:hypothetical protein V6U77_02235 [Micromonospora sp. CPCC 205546]|uniref:hypothetical protein n=1 Tax=Micromonospora sp. CPCC 205546 TaxID=3122397 RepID=UPI002FF2CA57